MLPGPRPKQESLFNLTKQESHMCVRAAFLGDESIWSVFTFYFSCDNQRDYVRVGKVALGHSEGECVHLEVFLCSVFLWFGFFPRWMC